MKFVIAFLSSFYLIYAQKENEDIFLNRDFWKTSPKVTEVKEMIDKGADPVKLNRYSFDAVCYAILENAPLESIKYLLSLEGNKVDKYTHDGRNYFMWAAYKGNINLMQHLIEKGSRTKIVDDHGYNPITFIAATGQLNLKVYDLLLENGSLIKDLNREGASSLLLLSPYIKDFAVVKYFTEKGLKIFDKDYEGNTMISYAARGGNEEIINRLIKLGVDYKTNNKNNGNAFMFAARGFRGSTNKLQFFNFLEKNGIDANIVTKENETPLHALAFRQKDQKVFNFFIDKGVDPNKINDDGNNALINAVQSNNDEIAKFLQGHTKNINHKNKEGMSALAYAFKNGNIKLVKFLLENGSNILTKDKNNRNVIAHLFESFSYSNKTNFNVLLNMCLKMGVNPNDFIVGNNNLIHLACEKMSGFLVKKAISFGQEINKKNSNGLTPLHLAAMKSKDNKLLKILIESGANKNALTDFQESVYDLAKENELFITNNVNIDFLK
tara:strand:- start:2261 stop:3748 length:1488 start_codon:yes stop_codon:yes gene_type:complete